MVSPTKLLLHCDGADAATTFADSSQSAHVVTAHGAAQLDTAQKEFGTASGYFTAAADYLSLDSATDFTFGTGDFTIETRLRRETTDLPVVLIDFRTSADLMPPYVYYDGALKYYCNGADRITAAATLAVGSWHHVAVCRAGSATRMFLDGVQVGSTYVAADNLTSAPTPRIGAMAFSLVEPETLAWVAKVLEQGGTVSAIRQTQINDLIAGMKADGTWVWDRIWIKAAENAQSALIDLTINDIATAVNSPTFMPDYGFKGDGVAMYVNTNFNPSTDAVYMLPLSITGGVWVPNVSLPSTGTVIGATDGTYFVDGTMNWVDDGNAYWRVSTDTWGGVTIPYPGPGLYLADRTDSYVANLYLNGVSIGSNVANIGGWPLQNVDVYVLARNNNGSPVSYTSDVASVVLLGPKLPAAKHPLVYNRLQTYWAGIGKPEAEVWAAAVQAAGGTVSNDRKLLMSDYFTALKRKGIFQIMDGLWIFTQQDQPGSLTDISPNHYYGVAYFAGSLTFTPDQGFTGLDNSWNVIDLLSDCSTQCVHFTPNEPGGQHVACWGLDNVQSDTSCVSGWQIMAITERSTTDLLYINVNDYYGTDQHPNTDSRGMFVGTRTNYNVRRDFINGVKVGEQTSAPYYVVPNVIRYGLRRLAMFSIGGPLTEAQVADYYTATQTLLRGIGTIP